MAQSGPAESNDRRSLIATLLGPHRQTMMATPTNLTFVAAVNNRELLRDNLLMSPCLREAHTHQIIVQEKFRSAAEAYNDAIQKSCNDLIVFAHQDIIFPQSWMSQLGRALDCLQILDPCWGALGCFGVSSDGVGIGHVYSSGRGVFGGPFDRPVQIQTLDEIVLVLRKSSGLRFDECLPHFHLYGADICLRAAKMRMKSYAISAFCIHNTQQQLVLPREFYECYKHVKSVWKDHMPIHTTCLEITKYNGPLYMRKLMEGWTRIRGKQIGAFRTNNPYTLLSEFRIPPREPSEGVGLSFLTRAALFVRGKRAKRPSFISS
jgi:hypothetical protein